MSYEEFAKISEQNKWGGFPGREFWPDIEAVHTSTNLTKEEVAFVYWVHTGMFESISASVKYIKDLCGKVASNKGHWLLNDLAYALDHLNRDVRRVKDYFKEEA